MTNISKNKFQSTTDESGFLTLEILIAMTVLMLMLAVVIMVSFGNQTMIVNSQTNAEALNIAQALLEKAQSDGRKDFNLVNPIAEVTSSDGFASKVNVSTIDYFSKLVTATVKFPEDNGLSGSTSLSSIVTNFNNVTGGDTCSSILLPNAEAWKTPSVDKKFSNFSGLTGISDKHPITDIDAYRDKLYVSIGATNNSVSPTLFVFGIDNSDPDNPRIITSSNFIDNDPTVQSGINAIVVAEDIANANTYVYAAANTTTKQLQVIDVTISPPVVKKTLTITGGSVGNSIFYKNGYIYLGLKSSTTGPEFHIIDVHSPLNPQEVGHWPTSGSLSHDINNIYVNGRYAFLATADSRNLIVLDISNASSPSLIGSFNDGGSNNGKSIFQAGDNLYLGRTVGGTELSILNEGDPATTTPDVLDSDATINKSVDGIIVRGKLNTNALQTPPALAFLLTPSDFRILDVSDSKNISSWGNEVLPSGSFGSGTYEPVLDCEGNNFFVGSNDSSNNGYISVITP